MFMAFTARLDLAEFFKDALARVLGNARPVILNNHPNHIVRLLDADDNPAVLFISELDGVVHKIMHDTECQRLVTMRLRAKLGPCIRQVARPLDRGGLFDTPGYQVVHVR